MIKWTLRKAVELQNSKKIDDPVEPQGQTDSETGSRSNPLSYLKQEIKPLTQVELVSTSYEGKITAVKT